MSGEIINGDCIDVMQSFESKSFKVVVTSPPYNLRNSSGNGINDARGSLWTTGAMTDGYENHDDNMPHKEYVQWQRECLAEMMRVVRDDGAIFYNHKWRVQKGLIQDRSDIVEGFPVRQIIIWHRKNGINFNKGFFLPTYEVIYLIAKPKFTLVPKANAIGDVWSISPDRGNPHPATFPIEIPERCIRSAGDGPVLDPFLGSGSTAMASEKLGIEWVGIEKSHQYCELSKQRLADFHSHQQALNSDLS